MDETIRGAGPARCTAAGMALAAAILVAVAANAQPAPPAAPEGFPAAREPAPVMPELPAMPGVAGEGEVAPEFPATMGEPAADGSERPAVSAPASGAGALPGPADTSYTAAAVSDRFGPTAALGPDPAVATGLPRDLSPWVMFQAADVVVKSVMIGLAVASLVTWTVCFAKSLEILVASLRLHRGLDSILRSDDLASAEKALGGRGGPAAMMLRAARAEAGASTDALRHGGGPGLLQRVASHLFRIEAQAGRRLNVGTGVLATIGATAPFVGLFGTVWGIMNSFVGISEAQTTNLAVVAPGIAEALLATALGLVAAIPAVVIYNVFARWTAGYRARLADAAAAVERLVSRDLDHRRLTEEPYRQAAE